MITKSTRKVTTTGKTPAFGIAGSYTAQNRDHVVCTSLSKSSKLRLLSIRLRSHFLPRVLNSPCCSSLSPNTVHLPAPNTLHFNVLRQGSPNLSVKGQRVRVFGFIWFLSQILNSSLVQKQPLTMYKSMCLIKFYLWTLKSEFNVIFICQYYFSFDFYFKP